MFKKGYPIIDELISSMIKRGIQTWANGINRNDSLSKEKVLSKNMMKSFHTV